MPDNGILNLKKCPFCSGTPTIGKKKHVDTKGRIWVRDEIYCMSCFASIDSPAGISDASDAWNTRVPNAQR